MRGYPGPSAAASATDREKAGAAEQIATPALGPHSSWSATRESNPHLTVWKTGMLVPLNTSRARKNQIGAPTLQRVASTAVVGSAPVRQDATAQGRFNVERTL